MAELKAIAQGLSAIAPAKVLWKLADSDLVMVGNASLLVADNIKVVKWAPQNDVLGHPNVKAFFTQGGTNSFNEVSSQCCTLPPAAFCTAASHLYVAFVAPPYLPMPACPTATPSISAASCTAQTYVSRAQLAAG